MKNAEKVFYKFEQSIKINSLLIKKKNMSCNPEDKNPENEKFRKQKSGKVSNILITKEKG